jgi:uncharacterized damage-inducible protein DinB
VKNNEVMKQYVTTTLENSRSYTAEVAEAMPADLYSTCTSENVWNFAELLNHIGYGIRWWESNMIKKEKMDWDPPVLPAGKKEVISYLQTSYDQLQQTLQNTKLTEEALQGFYATLDHITHHRGQAILCLRLKNIAAPEYRY